ncbi:hypothetical protein [Acaryochloris marina]|uniref:Uncharacterized protein n=1 Tax=Acaryochloris marina (strain MBIC 11017) TaxID=329726 RepID=B0C0E3_ACAM1|nr:hypothetical protein [Acaryochloris marina]ABW29635.1 hypothetical protein AM1_4661 [Acaryochloris marina MBIC11017]BDM78537.1 hypothetical protein AM10699_14060 [Acaryochloris marina MBIC10699]
MKNFNNMGAEEVYAYIELRLKEGVDPLTDEEFRRASEALRQHRKILSAKKVEEFLAH